MQQDFYENEETTAAVDKTVDEIDNQNNKKDYDEISNISKCPSDDRSDYELESNKEGSNDSKDNKQNKVKEEKKTTLKLDFDEVIMKEFADSSNDQNVVWCICQEGECSDDNEIIFWSTCWIPIHQCCYGGEILEAIPEGEWNWQRCQYWLDQKVQATKIKCAYCVNLKGAMKLISYNKWAHIVWVNWIPEIWFKDEKKEVVEISEFDSKKYRKKWDIWKKNKGFVLKCDEKRWSNRFHVTWAINKKIIYDWEKMKEFYSKKTKKSYDEKTLIPIYWWKHCKIEEKKEEDDGMDIVAAQAYMKKLARNNAKKQKEINQEKNKYFEDILNTNIFDYSSDRLFFHRLRKREQKEEIKNEDNLQQN